MIISLSTRDSRFFVSYFYILSLSLPLSLALLLCLLFFVSSLCMRLAQSAILLLIKNTSA